MSNLRLAVIPSDPLSAYVAKGRGKLLSKYYNPGGLFRDVVVLSPCEKGERQEFGLTVQGVDRKQFCSALRQIRPDVVRAYGGFWPADLACYSKIPNIPVVVSVHDSNPKLIHKSLRYADLVICMSKVVGAAVEKVGVSSDRIRILPNRVDCRLFTPQSDEQPLTEIAERFPKGKKYILHVGRKSIEKNLETVIRALTYLPDNFCSIFVGQGEFGKYIGLSEKLGVSERCFWIDSIPNHALPYWYSWADYFCVPSLWEGFGIVFVEAAACGSAIVTSNIAPMNEYLKNEESAILVDNYRCPEAIAHAILKLEQHFDLKEKISFHAVEVAKQFEQSKIDQLEMKIYQESLNIESVNLDYWYHFKRLHWKADAIGVVRRRVGQIKRSILGQ